MTLGLFVEGKSDKKAIPILIRKILNTGGKTPAVIARLVPRGDMFKAIKVRAYIKRLLNEHPEISKIVVCVDSECTGPQEIEQEVRKVKQHLLRLKVNLQYVVIVHALEAWLAADPKALRKVTGHTGIIPNLQGECRPAQVLERIVKNFRKTEHAPRLAQYSDVKVIASRNSSFREFRRAVTDP